MTSIGPLPHVRIVEIATLVAKAMQQADRQVCGLIRDEIALHVQVLNDLIPQGAIPRDHPYSDLSEARTCLLEAQVAFARGQRASDQEGQLEDWWRAKEALVAAARALKRKPVEGYLAQLARVEPEFRRYHP